MSQDDSVNPDLTTVTTAELIGELRERSESLVLGVSLKTDRDDSVQLVLHGTRLLCRGLVADLDDKVRRDSADALTSGEDEG